MKSYNPNKGTARTRLALLRAIRDDFAARHPDLPGTSHWSSFRFNRVSSAPRWSGASGDAAIVDALRHAGYADEIARGIRHKGWYTDAWADGVYRGQVWQLPGDVHDPRGVRRYVAGYVERDGEWAKLETDARGAIRVYPCEEEAAYAADALAERDARKAREWSEAESAVKSARDNLEQSRGDVRELIRDLREQSKVGPLGERICKRLRAELEAARDRYHTDIGKLREALDSLHWLESRA